MTRRENEGGQKRAGVAVRAVGFAPLRRTCDTPPSGPPKTHHQWCELEADVTGDATLIPPKLSATQERRLGGRADPDMAREALPESKRTEEQKDDWPQGARMRKDAQSAREARGQKGQGPYGPEGGPKSNRAGQGPQISAHPGASTAKGRAKATRRGGEKAMPARDERHAMKKHRWHRVQKSKGSFAREGVKAEHSQDWRGLLRARRARINGTR